MRRRNTAPQYGLGQPAPIQPMQPSNTLQQAKKKKGWPKPKARVSTGNPNP